MTMSRPDVPARAPDPARIRRWRRNLAEERAEGAVYRNLAQRKSGEEREILLGLAEAEKRHEQHWIDLLGPHAERPGRATLRSRLMAWLARSFGSVFVLALAQRAELRANYDDDADATEQMAADERVHGEVVRALAARGRARMSGTFRAAVFGANDGLVSNLALVLGIGATGVGTSVVLATGISGLLAGALSMGAGEYVSVRSQRELLESSTPSTRSAQVVPALDVDANELSLLYRARGMSVEDADAHARAVIAAHAGERVAGGEEAPRADEAAYEEIGTAWQAASSSFLFFASGAIIPVLPYLFGLTGLAAVAVAAALVGIALLMTGAVVGVLSGSAPLPRALRQLAIGYGAAAVTYVLGLLFGGAVG
ncbi:VIT1/CCC1 transporter family protein [Georgenia sp. Z1491]|uniref:VIT1/CCC1 transporter family protein n=1 Tax=Georgenia sp. Z1491 TaxID=3416707 RepID=UPI003CEE3EBD